MFRTTLVVVGLFFGSPALACSVIESYRVPTNLELTTQAKLIMLGKVEGGTPMGDGSPGTMQLTVRPLTALKGALPDGPLVLEGLALAPERFSVLSNPYELEGAHPLSYIGGCIRYMFPVGTTALFFLQQRDGKWAPAGGPFSRWAEDVFDPQSPWPKLVALYVRVAAIPEAERKTLLETERDRLLAEADDPVAHLMALDISRQLAGPNKPWNEVVGKIPGAGEEASADAAAEAVMDAVDAQEKKRMERRKR